MIFQNFLVKYFDFLRFQVDLPQFLPFLSPKPPISLKMPPKSHQSEQGVSAEPSRCSVKEDHVLTPNTKSKARVEQSQAKAQQRRKDQFDVARGKQSAPKEQSTGKITDFISHQATINDKQEVDATPVDVYNEGVNGQVQQHAEPQNDASGNPKDTDLVGDPSSEANHNTPVQSFSEDKHFIPGNAMEARGASNPFPLLGNLELPDIVQHGAHEGKQSQSHLTPQRLGDAKNKQANEREVLAKSLDTDFQEIQTTKQKAHESPLIHNDCARKISTLAKWMQAPALATSPAETTFTYHYVEGRNNNNDQIGANLFAKLLPDQALSKLWELHPWDIHLGGDDLAR